MSDIRVCVDGELIEEMQPLLPDTDLCFLRLRILRTLKQLIYVQYMLSFLFQNIETIKSLDLEEM